MGRVFAENSAGLDFSAKNLLADHTDGFAAAKDHELSATCDHVIPPAADFEFQPLNADFSRNPVNRSPDHATFARGPCRENLGNPVVRVLSCLNVLIHMWICGQTD